MARPPVPFRPSSFGLRSWRAPDRGNPRDPQHALRVWQRGGDGGYEIRGFPKVDLLFQAAGQVEDVAPELCGTPARRWRSVTPYLPVRHRKDRKELLEFLAADITAELRYRNRSHAVLSHVELAPELTGRQVNQYRRYRTNERLTRDSRDGVGLVLEFNAPVAGPLLLGQLSHFGFGQFVPVALGWSRALGLRAPRC